MRGPITPPELEAISKQVYDYVHDPSPEAHLDLGASTMSITAAFRALKKLCLSTEASGATPQTGSSTAGNSAPQAAPAAQPGGRGLNGASSRGADIPPNKGVQALQEENTKLRLQVQQRDNELSILVSMLKKREAVIQAAANTAAVPANGSSGAAEPPRTVAGDQSTASGEPDASGTAKATDSGANLSQGGASGEPVEQAVLFDLNSLADRNRAFELFRKSYRRNEAIESSKMVRKPHVWLAGRTFSAVAWLLSRMNDTRNSIDLVQAGAEGTICSS